MPEKRKKLLEVKHLKQYFGVGKPSMVKAVDDVSFHIFEGDQELSVEMPENTQP